MVKISSIANRTVQTTFESLEGSVIKLKSDLSGGEFERTVSGSDESKFLTTALSKMIIEWNLEDDEGKVLPINAENIRLIPVFDLKAVFAETNFGKRSLELAEKKMK